MARVILAIPEIEPAAQVPDERDGGETPEVARPKSADKEPRSTERAPEQHIKSAQQRDTEIRERVRQLANEIDDRITNDAGSEPHESNESRSLDRKQLESLQTFAKLSREMLTWAEAAEGTRSRRTTGYGYDRRELEQELDRQIEGSTDTKRRLADAMETCCEKRMAIIIEDPATTPARQVRVQARREAGDPAGICIVGPAGTGKRRLCDGIARSLGKRAHYTVGRGAAEWSTKRWLQGSAQGTGMILDAMEGSSSTNPVIKLIGIEEIKEDAAAALAKAMDAEESRKWTDENLGLETDASDIFWLATATSEEAIDPKLREHLVFVSTNRYSEDEKVRIANKWLLFPDESGRRSAAEALRRRSNARRRSPRTETHQVHEGFLKTSENIPGWLERTSGQKTRRGKTDESTLRWVIQAHTDEGGVADLKTMLGRVLNEAAGARAPKADGTIRITYEDARRVLGTGRETLPRHVAEAVREDRRRTTDGEGDPIEQTRGTQWRDWVENLPWSGAAPPTDREAVRKTLNGSHRRMTDITNAIVDHACTVRNTETSALCLAGPPGVGKTSVAQAVAEATGRPLARMSCGGWRDETDLRGHNRTWRSSQPGGIIRELRRTRCRWPVFVLDEIDKLETDPANVLLEILDPVQQREFRDAYVEIPFDLSHVLFITTANNIDRIPAALRDRLRIVHMTGYSVEDKVRITLERLLPEASKANGADVQLTEGACARLADEYTQEEGVRGLKRAVTRITEIASRNGDGRPTTIEASDLEEWLGPPQPASADDSTALAERVARSPMPAEARLSAHRALRMMENRYRSIREETTSADRIRTLLGIPWKQLLGNDRRRTTPEETRAASLRTSRKWIHGHDEARNTLARRIAEGEATEQTRAVCLSGPAATGKTTLARAALTGAGYHACLLHCASLHDTQDITGDDHHGQGETLKALVTAGNKARIGLILDGADRIQEAATEQLLAKVIRSRRLVDESLGIPIDLRRIPIIATVRQPDRMRDDLRSAFDHVTVYGYDDETKAVIAIQHLLPQALRRRKAKRKAWMKAAIATLVRQGESESGVEDLRKRIEDTLDHGSVPKSSEGASEPDDGGVGQANGVIVSDRGARLLRIEASASAGTGTLTQTGNQKQPLREAAMTARQWLIQHGTRFGLEAGWHEKTDLHVHMGDAEVQKSGDSAGLAIATAITSAVTGRRVRPGLVMTGAVGLGERMHAVGAIEEKALAAMRAGARRFYLPEDNRGKVERQIPAAGTEGKTQLVYVRTVHEAVDEILEGTDNERMG